MQARRKAGEWCRTQPRPEWKQMEQLDQGSGARHEDSDWYCISTTNAPKILDDMPMFVAEEFHSSAVEMF